MSQNWQGRYHDPAAVGRRAPLLTWPLRIPLPALLAALWLCSHFDVCETCPERYHDPPTVVRRAPLPTDRCKSRSAGRPLARTALSLSCHPQEPNSRRYHDSIAVGRRAPPLMEPLHIPPRKEIIVRPAPPFGGTFGCWHRRLLLWCAQEDGGHSAFARATTRGAQSPTDGSRVFGRVST